MANLTPVDWKAINWYIKEYGYTIKDMAAGPVIRLRDKKDKIYDINIFDIRTKYDKRDKRKKVTKVSA